LAIPLYYLFWGFEQKDSVASKDFAVQFMKEILKGYDIENKIAPSDIETIPLFLKLRDLTLYSFFYKKYDLKNKDQRLHKIVEKIEHRIKENRPIANFTLEDIY
jgi:amicoumacin kinase